MHLTLLPLYAHLCIPSAGSSDGTARLWDSRSLECIAVLRPPQRSAAMDTPVLAAVPLHGAAASAAAAAQAVYSKRSAASAAAAGTGPAGPSAGASGSGLRASLRSQEALLVASRGPAAHILASGGSHAGAVLCTLRHDRPAQALPAAPAAAAGSETKPATGAAAAGSARALADVVACAIAPQGRLIYLLLSDRALLAYAAGPGAFSGATALPVSVVEPAAAAGGGDPLGLALHPLRNLAATYATDGAVRLWKP